MTANNFVSPREENLNGVQSREINVSGRERWISIAGFRRFFFFLFSFFLLFFSSRHRQRLGLGVINLPPFETITTANDLLYF